MGRDSSAVRESSLISGVIQGATLPLIFVEFGVSTIMCLQFYPDQNALQIISLASPSCHEGTPVWLLEKPSIIASRIVLPESFYICIMGAIPLFYWWNV